MIKKAKQQKEKRIRLVSDVTKAKQRRIINKILEVSGNGNEKGLKGKVNIGKILREEGYSAKTALTPGSVLNTKSMQETMREMFAEERMKPVTDSIIDAAKPEEKSFPTNISDDEIKKYIQKAGGDLQFIWEGELEKRAYYVMPEGQVRVRGLQEVNKMTGRYAPDRVKIEGFSLTSLDSGEFDPFSE